MKKLKKTRHGDYEKVIKFPIFSGFRIFVIFTDDIAKSKKARYGTAEDTINASAVHCHDQENGCSHIIFDISKASEGTTAHECWHAVHAMFTWLGAGLENEMIAYHLGHVVQMTTDFYFNDVKSSIRKTKK